MMWRNRINKLFLLFMIGSVCLSSCRRIKDIVGGQSARELYVNSLTRAGLDNQQPVAQWLQYFEHALMNPVAIEIPYTEQLIIPVGDLRADAFAITLPAGRELHIEVRQQIGRGRLFAEVRQVGEPGKIIASMDTARVDIESENKDRKLILIIQAELMAYGKWNVSISHSPSFGFPVKGADASNIGSTFGDPRDGGGRKHHGIDIFAKKGTAALAVEDGWVYRTGQNNLGGNVVWLNLPAGNIYYAHLDQIHISPPQKVVAGDTLGFVGNTGNAKHTPPHLHFGIYTRSGPIDPLPFVRPAESAPPVVEFSLPWASAKVKAATNFRAGPGRSFAVLKTLNESTPVWIRGQAGEWMRVSTGGATGFVHSSLTLPVDPGALKVEFVQ